MHRKQSKRPQNSKKRACAGPTPSSAAHHQSTHKIRSKSQGAVPKSRITPAHSEEPIFFAGAGIFLNSKGVRGCGWPQGDRINWVNQQYLEHKSREHNRRTEPGRCRLCRDYEIWLAREEDKQTWGYLANSFAMARSTIRGAWGRTERSIPAWRLTEKIATSQSAAIVLWQPQPTYAPGSVRCSCGAIIQARTPELARSALEEHMLIHEKS